MCLPPTLAFYTHAQVSFIFEHHGHLRSNQTSHCLISDAFDYRNSSHQLLFLWTTANKWLNITAEWVALLLEIYQTSPQRLATLAGLLWFASFPPGKYYNCTSDLATTTSCHIFQSTLFNNQHTIQHHTIWTLLNPTQIGKSWSW
jgi:hypothetical protein